MTTAYPLAWPPGWPRTAPRNLKSAGQRFGQPTIASARDRLMDELRLLGVRTPAVLSSNLELRLAAAPDFYLCQWCEYARRCWEIDR